MGDDRSHQNFAQKQIHVIEFPDQASSIRSGEELDADKLAHFLRQALPGFDGPLTTLQFPNGYSNLTYLIKSGGREVVLRRPPVKTEVKSAHDMGREYRILSRLWRVYPQSPKALAYCEDREILGTPFYLLERVKGVILRRDLPEGFFMSAETMRRLTVSFIDNLANLHSLDYLTAGLGDLGKPEGYVKRQVEGWIRRYQASATDPIGLMDEVGAWFLANCPRESGAALIHNDYKFDNLVLDPLDLTKILGVLDWEMATIGDPLMDLGIALSYWVEPSDPEDLQSIRFGPTTAQGSLTRQELVERYEEKSRRNLHDPIFYYVYGLFRLAVILQQIYYRYVKGATQDQRFAELIASVKILAKSAARVVERDKI